MVHAHIGVGRCIVCGHWGTDCTGTRGLDPHTDPARLLVVAAEAQEDFWLALRQFELSLGQGDIDGLDGLDLCNETLESIRERFCK